MPEESQQPISQETEAARLRAMLMVDALNVPLRIQYLAARTPALAELDRGTVRTHWDAMKGIPLGLLRGAAIGVGVWGISWCLVALGLTVPEEPTSRREKIVSILLMFSTTLGLVVSVIAFTLATGLFAWSSGLAEKQRGRITGELGPLPLDAPDNLAKATQIYLNGRTD